MRRRPSALPCTQSPLHPAHDRKVEQVVALVPAVRGVRPVGGDIEPILGSADVGLGFSLSLVTARNEPWHVVAILPERWCEVKFATV